VFGDEKQPCKVKLVVKISNINFKNRIGLGFEGTANNFEGTLSQNGLKSLFRGNVININVNLTFIN
jgi:hypothetical protein